jgi:hypothetical protein
MGSGGLMSIDEQGRGSLLRDLLRLSRTFSLRRYRVDLIGFAVAWLLAIAMMGFYFWMSGWGSSKESIRYIVGH